jgi:hypothetical protein
MTDVTSYERIRRHYRRLLTAVDAAVDAGRELAEASKALDRAMSAAPGVAGAIDGIHKGDDARGNDERQEAPASPA